MALRISSNGLATLVENIIHEIMNKEKNEFLNSTKNDKSINPMVVMRGV